MTKQAIDLKRFCEDEEGRYAIQKPWVENGWRYATDGRIAVRVPATGEPDTSCPEGKRRPKGCELFKDFPLCESPLPELERVDKCDKCNGWGRKPKKCYKCLGGENHQCSCGNVHVCSRCGGKGLIDNPRGARCRFCGGNLLLPAEKQQIGHRVLAGCYLSIIAELPNVRIQLNGEEESPLAFTSGALQGLLMPLVKDKL